MEIISDKEINDDNKGFNFNNSDKKIILTADQENAMNDIRLFLKSPENVHILSGSAGTGKSFLTSIILQSEYFRFIKICAICPTHKAKYVLQKLNKGNLAVCTIASILSKIKEHSYIGTKNFSNGSDNKLHKYDFFILDEVSMVSNLDIDFIINFMKKYKKKLLCIGDPYQIPPPNGGYVKIKLDNINYVYKGNSITLTSDLYNKSILHEIVRQSKDSPIIKLATYYRDHILDDINLIDLINNKLNKNKLEIDIPDNLDIPNNPDIPDIPDKTSYNSIQILTEEKMLESYMHNIKLYPTGCRCIVYTNQSVLYYNLKIREALLYKEIFNKGEILMAYNTLGYPINYIENGNEYVIQNVSYTKNLIIKNFYGLHGHLVRLENVSKILFFIDVNNENNKVFMSELIRLAQIVNSKNSSKQDFARYSALRNEVVFIDSIYQYKCKFYDKYKFKAEHPLLFIKTNVYISSEDNGNGCLKKINKNTLSSQLLENANYKEIIDNRLDDNKQITDNELLSDPYMILEKDMDYAYCITAHKSQGSTYDVCYLYDNDFNNIKNSYNYNCKCTEYKIREKNTLKYVGITRAKSELYIF